MRDALRLAPALAVLGGLTGGALVVLTLRAIGGAEGPWVFVTLVASPAFREGLALSLWIALASTALALGLGLALAGIVAPAGRGRGALTGLMQAILAMPHAVAALGVLYLLAQSGLLARVAFAGGLIERPAEFPALVQDRWAFGVILLYAWKEAPFVALVALGQLAQIGARPAEVARCLGARPAQVAWHVTLPLLRPALVRAGAILMAFVLGAYEVPLLLGASHPQVLAVQAWQGWTATDLDRRPAAAALALVVAGLAVVVLWPALRQRRRG